LAEGEKPAARSPLAPFRLGIAAVASPPPRDFTQHPGAQFVVAGL